MQLHQRLIPVIAFALCAVVVLCTVIAALDHGEGHSKVVEAPGRATDQLLSGRTVSDGLGEREAQVRSDLPAKRPHPWAGRYYIGNGLAGRDYVELTVPSGIACTQHYCIAPPVTEYGTAVEISKNRLRVKFQNKSTHLLFSGNSADLMMVQWGDRRYLIPAEDMMEFVSAVNLGTELRYGSFPLRAGDEKKQVRGKPELPEEFARLILERPVRAKITAIGKPVVEDGANGLRRDRRVKVTIDRGKSHGIFVGMKLALDEVEFGPLTRTSRVVSVRDKTAVVALVLPRRTQEGASKPRVGWRLSTHQMSIDEWVGSLREKK